MCAAEGDETEMDVAVAHQQISLWGHTSAYTYTVGLRLLPPYFWSVGDFVAGLRKWCCGKVNKAELRRLTNESRGRSAPNQAVDHNASHLHSS